MLFGLPATLRLVGACGDMYASVCALYFELLQHSS
jgi:hypothetical protein